MKGTASRRNLIFKDLFIGVIDDKIVEMKRPSGNFLFSNNKAKITFMIPLLSLLKIEYSTKKGTIMLYFKQDSKHPVVYSTPNYIEAAKMINNVMNKLGVQGKHRTPEMELARTNGLKLCQDIKKKQKSLGNNPSMEEVREIIDLHCLAAEKLAFGRDDRHVDIISHMNKFIGKTKISRLLSAESESIKSKSDQSDVSSLSSGNTASSSSESIGSGSQDESYQSLDEILDGERDENAENQQMRNQYEGNQVKQLRHKTPVQTTKPESLIQRHRKRLPLQRRVVA